jgi:type IV conjugative transfer system protein TraE
MFKNISEANFAYTVKQRNTLLMLFLGACLVNGLLAVSLIFKSRQVVIVPMGFSKEFMVSNKEVTKEYLEVMTFSFAPMLLNHTPSSFNYSKNMVLKHVTPSAWQYLKAKLDKAEQKHKELNLATNFTCDEVELIDTKNLIAQIKGRLNSWYGLDSHREDKVTFKIQFSFDDGILKLKEFDIINNN